MHFSARGLTFGNLSFVEFMAVFNIARILFERRNFFSDIFLVQDFYLDEGKQISSWIFFDSIGLLVEFSLQSEDVGIS